MFVCIFTAMFITTKSFFISTDIYIQSMWAPSFTFVCMPKSPCLQTQNKFFFQLMESTHQQKKYITRTSTRIKSSYVSVWTGAWSKMKWTTTSRKTQQHQYAKLSKLHCLTIHDFLKEWWLLHRWLDYKQRKFRSTNINKLVSCVNWKCKCRAYRIDRARALLKIKLFRMRPAKWLTVKSLRDVHPRLWILQIDKLLATQE